MSRIRYFQRSASLESAANDAVLELIASTYHHAPTMAAQLLSQLTGVPVELGLEVSRRLGGEGQAEGGEIVQRSFRVFVEAKVDAAVSMDQTRRQAERFREGEAKFMLLVTREPAAQQERMISALIEGSRPDVVFKNVTYRGICKAMRELCFEGTPSLADPAREFEGFCAGAGLLSGPDRTLWVVPCGRMHELHMKRGVWFQPSDRPVDPLGLIGLYAGGRVRGILSVEAVFDVETEGDRLERTLVRGTDSERFEEPLGEIVREAKSGFGADIASGHRFYCGEVHTTDLRKSVAGEVLEVTPVDLGGLVETFTDAADVAAQLSGKKWR